MCRFESLKINPNNKIKAIWTQNSLSPFPPTKNSSRNPPTCMRGGILINSEQLAVFVLLLLFVTLVLEQSGFLHPADGAVSSYSAPLLDQTDWWLGSSLTHTQLQAWAALPQQDGFQITQHLLLFDRQHLARLLLMDCGWHSLKAFIRLSACF